MKQSLSNLQPKSQYTISKFCAHKSPYNTSAGSHGNRSEKYRWDILAIDNVQLKILHGFKDAS